MPVISSCALKNIRLTWNDLTTRWSFWGDGRLTKEQELDIIVNVGKHSTTTDWVYFYFEITDDVKGDKDYPLDVKSCEVTSEDGTISNYEVIFEEGLFHNSYIVENYKNPKVNDKIVIHVISRIQGRIHLVLTSLK